MPSKTPGVSKKGRNSQRGRGKGHGRCITASPAASVAEPDAIHGATEPQLQTAAGRAEAEVHDSDGSSVASTAIEKMKMMKLATDLSPEEEQTMTMLVLRQLSLYQVLVTSLPRQCSLYYVIIKFLLHPHSTTSSLRFLNMSKVRPRPPRSWRPHHV